MQVEEYLITFLRTQTNRAFLRLLQPGIQHRYYTWSNGADRRGWTGQEVRGNWTTEPIDRFVVVQRIIGESESEEHKSII